MDNAELLLKEHPTDKIDSNIKFLFNLLTGKDFKTAKAAVAFMKKNENPIAQQLAEQFLELIDFLTVFVAGKELRAAMRDLNSISLDAELDALLPEGGGFEEQKEDINIKGILTPLIVQEVGEKIILVDGYNRYKAAKELGIRRVPVVSISPTLDAKMVALAVNLYRRHLNKEERASLIQKLPIPKVGRPKKDEPRPPTATQVAKEMGVSKDTIKRARRAKKGAFAPFSNAIPPSKLVKEEKIESPQWFKESDLLMLDKIDYLQGMGFYFDFTNKKVDMEALTNLLEKAITSVLGSVKKTGMESQVDRYRMKVSFEARKKETQIALD